MNSLMNPKDRNLTIAGTMAGAVIGFIAYAAIFGQQDLADDGQPNMIAVLGFIAAGGIVGGIVGDRL